MLTRMTPGSPHLVRRTLYIWEQRGWLRFTWDDGRRLEPLAGACLKQGRLLGSMASLGFDLKREVQFEALTEEGVMSSEIAGEILDLDSVRSSLARRLGLPTAAIAPADRQIEGVVDMMLDATENQRALPTSERLFGWQAAWFPTGCSGMYRIKTGAWRDDVEDRCRSFRDRSVVSGCTVRRRRLNNSTPRCRRTWNGSIAEAIPKACCVPAWHTSGS